MTFQEEYRGMELFTDVRNAINLNTIINEINKTMRVEKIKKKIVRKFSEEGRFFLCFKYPFTPEEVHKSIYDKTNVGDNYESSQHNFYC